MKYRLLNTAWLTSLFAYIGFFALDIWKPGFVSYVFSVHLWLLLAIIFGTALALLKSE